ncbi:MAG: hypothetical protein KDJ73_08390 [Notoacmeibacter sp.]|nr:hypothetical protein [Notoacmeibacter sp.]
MNATLPDGFLRRLAAIPDGAGEGIYRSRRWGVTVTRSADGRRIWLYGEERGGMGRVSFNLYLTGAGSPLLKPCEMPEQEVTDFILAYEPEAPVQPMR